MRSVARQCHTLTNVSRGETIAIEQVVAFVASPEKMLAVTSSLVGAILLLLAYRKYEKPALLYAHVFLILSPLFYFALSINCGLGVLKGFLSWCTALFAKFVLFGIPPLLALSIIGGYLVLPRLYRVGARQFRSQEFSQLCKSTGIHARLFIKKSGIPEAYTIGKDIFVTVGLFDVLNKKELEAVLLHELYHVRSGASNKKRGMFIARVFSPVAWFSASSTEAEEIAADAFAARQQGTVRFVKGAQTKLS